MSCRSPVEGESRLQTKPGYQEEDVRTSASAITGRSMAAASIDRCTLRFRSLDRINPRAVHERLVAYEVIGSSRPEAAVRNARLDASKPTRVIAEASAWFISNQIPGPTDGSSATRNLLPRPRRVPKMQSTQRPG